LKILFLFILSIAILLVQPVFTAVQTVAVLSSDGILNENELKFFTDKAQEIAVGILPRDNFEVFQQDVIIKRLGGADNYLKECKEISCIVDLGKKASVDYVTQCQFGKFGSDFTITFELYKVSTSGLIAKFSETAKDIKGLRTIVEKKVPEVFLKIPGAFSQAKTAFVNELRVFVNGQVVRFDQQLVVEKGTLLAPIKPIADLMNAEMQWRTENQTIEVKYENKIISATIGHIDMTVVNIITRKEENVKLLVPPEKHNGIVFFPIEAITRALLGDKSVTWDKTSNTLRITTPGYKPPPILSQSFAITGMDFVNTKYDWTVIGSYGTSFESTALKYLVPRITYDNIGFSSGNRVLNIKIIKPDGSLETGKDSPSGYSYNHTLNVQPGKKEQKVLLTGWGSENGGLYSPGTYTCEIWSEGKKLYSAIFTVHSNSYLRINDKTEDSTTFTHKGDAQTFSVSTNENSYDIIHLPPWCSVANKYRDSFTLKCNSNANASSRRDYFIVVSGYKSATILITQYGTPGLNIGASIGTSFATPLLITTLHGIFSPLENNMFFELGLDLGLIYKNNDEPSNYYYSVDGYYSLYPFVNIGHFWPFMDKNSWYLGAGFGYMFGKYTFEDGNAYLNIPALNFTTGFIIYNFFNTSYSLRTNFRGVSNKVAVGIIAYRFE